MSKLKDRSRTRWTMLVLAAVGVVAAGMGAMAGTGSAAGSPPVNTKEPTISGEATVGHTLTADPGTWTGTQPIHFTYQWRRCDASGSGCSDIDGATGKAYNPAMIDAGARLDVRLTATNSAGSSSATSAKTDAITGIAPVTGCPTGTGTVPVDQVSRPARLMIDQQQFTPSVVTRGTTQVSARVHVSDTCGQAVSGALVYLTGVPYHQLTNAPEQATDSTGWATFTLQTTAGFPASPHEQHLAMFVRARKPGDNPLTGISIRRLVSIPVNLNS